MTGYDARGQRPEPMTPEVFDPYRMYVAVLARDLCKAEALQGEERATVIKQATSEFHSNVPYIMDHPPGTDLLFGLGTDENHRLNQADFLHVATVAQQLYHMGEHSEAMKFARAFGAPAIPLRMRINNTGEFHESVARELNNWYVGYFIHRTEEASFSSITGDDMFLRMGMANPTMQLLDNILLGAVEHNGFAGGIDDVQRKHLEEWRAKVAEKHLPDRRARQLREDPDAVMRDLIRSLGITPE